MIRLIPNWSMSLGKKTRMLRSTGHIARGNATGRHSPTMNASIVGKKLCWRPKTRINKDTAEIYAQKWEEVP